MTDQNDPLIQRIQAAEQKASALEDVLRKTIAFHQNTADAVTKALDRLGALEKKLGNHITANMLKDISKIYPKTKTVLFIGTSYFGDNIKYAFLAFRSYAKKHNIACYFLTEHLQQYEMLLAAGLPCLKPFSSGRSKQDFEILLSAQTVVLSDTFHSQTGSDTATHALLKGAKFIQLWHGIPLKEIGLQHLGAGEVMAACGTFEALVATNLTSRREWDRRFAFHEFYAIGHARNDVFFRDPSPDDLLNTDAPSLASMQEARKKGTPVVFYAPTFRDHCKIEWLEKAKLDKLNQHCRSKGCELYVNLHPCEQIYIASLQPQYPEIHFIAPHTDIYPLVKFADILISDYSSLAFDFLLLDRPLISYRPDHEDYITNSRALIPGREHYASGGPVTYDIDGLTASISAALDAVCKPETDPYRKARHALCKELFDFCDGKASDRVSELIAQYLDAA